MFNVEFIKSCKLNGKIDNKYFECVNILRTDKSDDLLKIINNPKQVQKIE
jgi:hypothetical protein